MIGHPRRIARNVINRSREICHMLKYSLLPGSYHISYKWGCLYGNSGKNNDIQIESWCSGNLMLLVSGNNNRVHIGKDVRFGPKCMIVIDGDNSEVVIGDKCSFTRKLHLAVTEGNSKCIIGKDCMFSYNIVVRTSDAHPVYDAETKNRLNLPADVVLDNHVWVGPNTTISKGVHIGSNSVIAQNSVVTKSIPSSVVAAGAPASVKRQNIHWNRIITDDPFENCEIRYVPDLRHKMLDEWMS